MAFPTPEALLAPWLPACRPIPPGCCRRWRRGLAGAAGVIAFHHSWIGAGLLLAGLAAAGLAAAQRMLTLGLLALPFGFALADASAALAAMFAMFALTVLTVLERGHVSVVTWLAAGVFLVACLFPDRFSLLSYLVGITAFVVAGQGAAKRSR